MGKSEENGKLENLRDKLKKRVGTYLNRSAEASSLTDRVQQNAKARALKEVIHDIDVILEAD